MYVVSLWINLALTNYAPTQMTTLELVIVYLLSGTSPFGMTPFEATDFNGEVFVTFPKQGVTIVMDEEYNYDLIEGEIITCQPEKEKPTDV